MNQIQFTDIHNLTKYVFAGVAVIKLHNSKTDRGFTFKISKNKSNQNLFYIYLLTHNKHYRFLGGYSFKQGYIHSFRSVIVDTSLSVKAIQWFFTKLQFGNLLRDFPHISVFHVGICGRCGKQITSPESIQTGYGAKCLQLQILAGNYIPLHDTSKLIKKHDVPVCEIKVPAPKKEINIPKSIQTTLF